MNSDNLKKGYIKVSRSLLEHSLWKERREFSRLEAWLDLLFSVNYSENTVLLNNTLFVCERGQCLYSLETWRSRWGWKSKHRVKDFLTLLAHQDMISYENVGTTVRITVVNYDYYQHQNGENSQDSKTIFPTTSAQVRNDVATKSGQNREHLNTTITASYEEVGNATGTQRERNGNATGTQRERNGNQVIKVIKVIKETKENVCELDTHKSSILESEIQLLREKYITTSDEINHSYPEIQMLYARVQKLDEGAGANSLSFDEWLLEGNDAVKKYNASNDLLNAKKQSLFDIEIQGNIKKKELEALKSQGQYAIFSDSVFSDKDFFVHSLQERLKESGLSIRKDEILEYYDRAKSYSASKLMKSADWIQEVSGWVRKDKVKLKKAS